MWQNNGNKLNCGGKNMVLMILFTKSTLSYNKFVVFDQEKHTMWIFFVILFTYFFKSKHSYFFAFKNLSWNWPKSHLNIKYYHDMNQLKKC